MSRLRRLAVGLLSVPLLLGFAGPAPAQDDTRAAGLVDGHGRTETEDVCTLCHTAAEFAGQRLSRNGWELVVSTMVDEYDMPAPDSALRETVLDYLSAQFGPAGAD